MQNRKFLHKVLEPDDPEGRRMDAQNRKCLICKTPFPSEWAGERICPKCKKSTLWRRG